MQDFISWHSIRYLYESTWFRILYPTLMALLIYAGSVEFIAAGALIAPFSPISVLLITLMISARQIFMAYQC